MTTQTDMDPTLWRLLRELNQLVSDCYNEQNQTITRGAIIKQINQLLRNYGWQRKMTLCHHPKDKIISYPADETIHERRGCLACDTWLTPCRLIKP